MKFITNSQRILYELFKQEYHDNTFSQDESHFFENFASAQIMNQNDLSDEEIENGIVGDGNDGGCDAIYTIYNNCLMTEDLIKNIAPRKNSTIDFFIIQAKKESSFSEDAIMKWKTTSQNLLEIGINDSKYSARYNEGVLSSFSLFRELYVKLLRNSPLLNIHFCYATFSTEVHPNVQAQADELKKIIHKLFPSPKTSAFVDFWDANKLLIAAQTQQERRLDLPLAETPINIGTHQDYVALVNLGKYYKFITDEQHELRKYIFDANVRDYQGHNSVNQDIQTTLNSSSNEEFWWLNNGITILTEKAELVTSKELILTDPEIVNGLQTSNEIFRHFKENPQEIDNEKRNILVRIIVPESEESRDKIILATNNQTNIPKSSLRANDQIHWQIELFFKGRGLYYDRRKNYYKNQGKKSSQIVSVSFLAQCMMSLLLQKPNYARARPSTLLAKDETYKRLYIKNQNLDVFYNAAMLGKKTEKIIKGSSKYTQAQKNDILFYVLYFSVAMLFHKTTLTVNDIQEINLDDFSDQYVLDMADQVFAEYTDLGGNGKVAKGSELLDRLISMIS
jgi:hypothetical protein